jgi:hypothetical protein
VPGLHSNTINSSYINYSNLPHGFVCDGGLLESNLVTVQLMLRGSKSVKWVSFDGREGETLYL